MTFRPGRSVFVLAAHGPWGAVRPGAIPVRLYRSFHFPGDVLGKYRLDAEYCWCLNYEMLNELGPDVINHVPVHILAAMRLNGRLVLETNWPVADEFETVTGDVHMLLPAFNFNSVGALLGMAAVPSDDPDASIHMGTLLLALTPKGELKQHKWSSDNTWHNYALGFIEWSDSDTLEDLVPPALRQHLPSEVGLVPISADYESTFRFSSVEARGGPIIPATGEQILVAADEARIYGQIYDDAGVTRRAYVTGDPNANMLQGIEMLTHDGVAEICEDAHTQALLDEPDLEKRLYLNNQRDLMPGYRIVTFSRSSITGQFVSVNPSLLEGMSCLEAEEVYTFEGGIKEGGAFFPFRRFGERAAAVRIARVVVERRGRLVAVAQKALQGVVVERSLERKKLDPFEATVPFPFEYMAALPIFLNMRRSKYAPSPPSLPYPPLPSTFDPLLLSSLVLSSHPPLTLPSYPPLPGTRATCSPPC